MRLAIKPIYVETSNTLSRYTPKKYEITSYTQLSKLNMENTLVFCDFQRADAVVSIVLSDTWHFSKSTQNETVGWNV